MRCDSLSPVQGNADFSRYNSLHPDGHHLIAGWFERAWERRDSPDQKCFEPFIYAWFAVNGWAACVTGLDNDLQYIDRLTRDQSISHTFDELMTRSDSEFTKNARLFANMWPIFKVQRLRFLKISQYHNGNRERVVKQYLSAGADKFEPQCWQDHQDRGDVLDVYLDWRHTLAAIYRVRCNLFHGEKMADSEMDHRIVGSAFRTLIHFFREAGHL